ncbi:CaCA family Na(+)/Ca(+) antiporter [Calothrix parasitica NIES-267]|uniref:CaCA family Na(+)/Ca(+) antiporter n=1 Tax=Calothrix parasitica NIES-267 TaxID=1973488 RepID=A0A1Z4LPB9_9CYAN|nr:CaCA family Na(+)/Ca(+) antiporter [Calothrix parasitica NIES-267]
MSILPWVLLLLASVYAAHWGADKIAEPLQKLREQWGFSEAAGAAFVAFATASPEIGTNATSAVRGLSDIGLGNLLGSNIISVPAIVTVAYIASLWRNRGKSRKRNDNSNQNSIFLKPLKVKSEALYVQAIPYLLIVAIAALITLPKPWRGLQPIDAWIMLAAYIIYLGNAILRHRKQRQEVEWNRKEIITAVIGIILLMFGAYFTVTATEKIVSNLGIPQVIGGLFITATLSIVPEVFATWSVASSGQMTAATTSVIADNTATMTLAFFPLALVTLPIENLLLYSVNLGFVALLGVVYAAFLYIGKPNYSFSFKEVLILNGIYIVYLAVMVFGVLKV